MSSPEEFLKRVKAREGDTLVAEPTSDPRMMLPFMERGYRWSLMTRGSLFASLSPTTAGDSTAINLSKGGAYYKFPLPKNDKGWLLHISAIFSNPFGTLRFRLHDWSFEASPYLLDFFQSGLQFPPPSNWIIQNAIWNPLTAYGPLYGIMLDTVEPLPITEDLSLEVYNPSFSLTSTLECLAFSVGYIKIDDYEEFLDEYQRAKTELKTGAKVLNWNRRKR